MGIQDCIEYLLEKGYEVRGLSNDDILTMVEDLQYESGHEDLDVDWDGLY